MIKVEVTIPTSWLKSAIDAEMQLSNWLATNYCDCEIGHYCGRNEIERARNSLTETIVQMSGFSEKTKTEEPEYE